MDVLPQDAIEKLQTGIPGFEHISHGGIPKGRTTLISGTSGSAKTVFSTQFLVEGIRQYSERGVFVTFEEPPADIRENMKGFGWDLAHWEQEGKFIFVDAALIPGEEATIAGNFDMAALLARIELAIKKVNATRVALDSIGAILQRFENRSSVRSELGRIAFALKQMGVTTVMTAERSQEYGPVASLGVEEFIADNVIIIRNVLVEEKRRRTIEILKFRGTPHQKGEFPFTVRPGQGVVILPLSAISLTQKSSSTRISSGNEELDAMCGGGFFRDSIILITGATGCGKTLLTNVFLSAGVKEGERCLLIALEESRDQVFRNALGWGMNFEDMEHQKLMRVACTYPEHASLEDHFIAIKALIEEVQPDRIAVDSLSALQRVASPRAFREFAVSLTSFVKEKEIAGLFTSASSYLNVGTGMTEEQISTITDSIILLRYVEFYGEMHRGLTVFKMRGSGHDKGIREFTIDHQGINIGKSFRHITGIIKGNPEQVPKAELERLSELFSQK